MPAYVLLYSVKAASWENLTMCFKYKCSLWIESAKKTCSVSDSQLSRKWITNVHKQTGNHFIVTLHKQHCISESWLSFLTLDFGHWLFVNILTIVLTYSAKMTQTKPLGPHIRCTEEGDGEGWVGGAFSLESEGNANSTGSLRIAPAVMDWTHIDRKLDFLLPLGSKISSCFSMSIGHNKLRTCFAYISHTNSHFIVAQGKHLLVTSCWTHACHFISWGLWMHNKQAVIIIIRFTVGVH